MGSESCPTFTALRVVAAPLSGISDAPFRTVAARWGADLVVSEMVASRAVLESSRQARRERAKLPRESGIAVQLAGCDPALMAEAARVAEGEGAASIDINFGCPAKKVVNQAAGSALMADEALAGAILAAVVRAVSVPVSVKMRLGWRQDRRNAARIAEIAEACGIGLLAVHGRTRDQGFKGQADWSAVAAVRAVTGLPLLVNGDIATPRDAVSAKRAAGSQGVMIGRGACGRPWLLREAKAALCGRPLPAAPDLATRADSACQHYQAILLHYGREQGLRIARKHLGWYLDALPGGEAWRACLLRSDDPDQVLRDLELAHETAGEAAPACVAAA
ncbi:MAG: tRNA dihydrouridine synthase DusB [Rhodospirillales bacterium]